MDKALLLAAGKALLLLVADRALLLLAAAKDLLLLAADKGLLLLAAALLEAGKPVEALKERRRRARHR